MHSPQRNGRNVTTDGGLELELMAATIGQHQQDNPQNQSSQLPEILVKEFQENEGDVAHQGASEQLTTSEERRHTMPGKAPPVSASYKGLQRNDEPTHSFIRTVSNFYRRNK